LGWRGGIDSHAYVEGDPVSLNDPTGEYGWVGFLVGGGIDIAWQTIIEGKSLRCINIGSVLTSATIGALTPGMLALTLEAKAARLPVKALQSQLASARTANRAAKIQSRIDSYLVPLTNNAQLQGLLSGVGWLIKKSSADKPWTVGSECECQE
jgi:hypothetical protein